MASNALASIAAATAAGYVLERTTLANGSNVTRLSKKTAGVPGKEGAWAVFAGEASTSGAADTAALGNLNNWRANRYGSDSAGINLSPQKDAQTDSHTNAATSHTALTKDRD